MNYDDPLKDIAWMSWRESWNQRGSTDSMSKLEESTAQTRFEQYWEQNS